MSEKPLRESDDMPATPGARPDDEVGGQKLLSGNPPTPKAFVRKTFSHGFELTETELRRLYKEIEKAFAELPTRSSLDLRWRITVEFGSGSLVELKSVDELLEYDNSGKFEIIFLELRGVQSNPLKDGESKMVNLIRIGFRNCDHELYKHSEEPPLFLYVAGTEPMWVHTNASTIEDRIKRIRSLGIAKKDRHWVCLIASGTLMLLAVAALLPVGTAGIDAIEARYRAGEFSDIAELVLAVGRVTNPPKFGQIALAFPAMLVVFMVVLPYAFDRGLKWLWPQHLFTWGDAIERERRRKSRRWIFFGVVVLGIVINFVSMYLWEKYT